MTTNLTVLPTRVDGSLGRLKTDPKSAIALDHQVAAVEYETLADWVKEIAAVVGPQTVYDRDTLRALLDPNFYLFREPFDSVVAGVAGVPNPDYWDDAGDAAGTIIAGLRGGLSLDLDVASTASRMLHMWTRAQQPRFSCLVTLTGAPGAFSPLIWFRDAGGVNGWGLAFNAANQIEYYIVTGGVPDHAAVDLWVLDTEVAVDVEVRSDLHMWVTVTGGTQIDCGAVPAADVTFVAHTSGGGAAGEHILLRGLRITANWTT